MVLKLFSGLMYIKPLNFMFSGIISLVYSNSISNVENIDLKTTLINNMI